MIWATYPLHQEELAPDNLCIEVYDQFYLLAKKNRHPLTLRLPDETVPKIHADAERMQQLLAILLHNAMEHTPDGTPIELVLSVEKTAIKISVIDHGPGISDSAKTQIFERFYRGDASRSSKRILVWGFPSPTNWQDCTEPLCPYKTPREAAHPSPYNFPEHKKRTPVLLGVRLFFL